MGERHESRSELWALAWLQQLSDGQLSQRSLARGVPAGDLLARIRTGEGRALEALRARLAEHPPPPEVPAGVVLRCDDDYPERLRHVDGPPFALWLAGDATLLGTSPAVAIVGSRRPRPESRELARQLAGALARAGVVIVSGLAVGVDGLAHRAALLAGGRTIAVLGSGRSRVHPGSHRSLAHDIAEGGGLLVSEYAPDVQARPWRFPARNRIIAALADYVVVVQARRESGSMSTVAHAADLGVGVGAVPSGIGDIAFAGSLDVLRDGGRAIVDATSVLRELGIEPDTTAPAHQFGGMLDVPRMPGELAACFELPLEEVLLALLDLELDGLVTRTPEGAYVNVRAA